MHATKQWLKWHLPAPIMRPVFAWRSRRHRAPVSRSTAAETFTNIYNVNHWGSQSLSRPGSEAEATSRISAALPSIIRDLGITSMLDVPCGDFSWMSKVDLGGIPYTGCDIVQSLIDRVAQVHASSSRRFFTLDLTCDPLPAADLVFCRDCFIHLPFKLIHNALMNIRKSGARFLLTTSYCNWPFNYDTCIGGARGIDLCGWPFHLPSPTLIVHEDQPAGHLDSIRSMALWPVDAIPVTPTL